MSDSLPSTSGYCFPLALDSVLKRQNLPQEFYDFFKAIHDDPNGGQNRPVSHLLRNFFGVEPQSDNDMAAVAKYNAYGASVQSYCPDVQYDFSEELTDVWAGTDVTGKQLRLRELLHRATDLKCLIIFGATNSLEYHARAIEVIDEGGEQSGPLYVIRDESYITGQRIYDADELAGVTKGYGGYSDDVAPLPEIARPYYPHNGTSWELTILPPEPA